MKFALKFSALKCSVFAAAALLTFAALDARAEMTFTSGFAPTQCGPQLNDTAHRDTHVMQAVCVGLYDAQTRAVQFTMSDDTTFVFKVVGQTNLMMALASGGSVAIFHLEGTHGEQLSMRALLNADGTVRSLSGNFQTNDYSVPVLQQMLTVQ